MANKQETLDLIAAQAMGSCDVKVKKMFGEAALYLDDVMVALICDDRLFIKPTKAGHEILGDPELAPPYPGAKDHFLISEAQIEKQEWLCELLAVTKAELPAPKPKKPKKQA